ncbi:MAG: molybdopterin-dependent oxidoreductase [Bacteroidia bacterium]|nr:molybdopterin-dependent oxidoreductase [Bacteroidia bacterium]
MGNHHWRNDESTTQFHHVYWSEDHGKTMRDRWDDLVAAVKAFRRDSYVPKRDDMHASVNGIIVNSKDPKKVLLWGDGLYSYITTDGGNTLKVLPVPANTLGLAHDIRAHPTQPDWLVSLAYRSVCYQYGGEGCTMDLFLTTDFGANWQNLTAATGGRVSGFVDFDWGYHNDDPKQMFRSSLPVGRVLEDYADLPPVILCYKLNGQWLSAERGGPVRIVVPEAYGFKCIKWLTHVVLSNGPAANDTSRRRQQRRRPWDRALHDAVTNGAAQHLPRPQRRHARRLRAPRRGAGDRRRRFEPLARGHRLRSD